MTIRALYTATSGMQVQQASLDTIANNIANASTTAYKRTRINFEDLFYQYDKLPGTQDANGLPTPIGLEYGLGARVAGTELDQTQGTFTQTNGQLDLAISGPGFFQVQDPQTGQTLYTRAGNFSVNANGQVVIASADLGRPLHTEHLDSADRHPDHDFRRRRRLGSRAAQYEPDDTLAISRPSRSSIRRD